jgi:MFS family permease
MGIGGAVMMPATLSLITGIFTDTAERQRAIGLWAGTSGLGVALGPIIGGALLARFRWGSVFLITCRRPSPRPSAARPARRLRRRRASAARRAPSWRPRLRAPSSAAWTSGCAGACVAVGGCVVALVLLPRKH